MHDFLVERKIFNPQSKPNATHQRQLVEMHLALPCGGLPSHKVVPNQDVGACQLFQMEVHRIRKISLALPRKDIREAVKNYLADFFRSPLSGKSFCQITLSRNEGYPPP